MKRIALSVAAAIAALGLGACEKHSADTLPPEYLHKRDAKNSDAGHRSEAPARGDQEKAPDAAHKG